ncbi:MAG: ATP-grasp domain-containing protein [Kordiimonadaceae bacterium]|nr:ATP-grasp domain-containing protein [Kordiimonadaceae bacterium]
MKKIKTIMILGAGIFQVDAICKAVDLGYHVITVDYLPNNIGHTYSHQYINLSTTDTKSIIKAAKANQVDGIFTMASDIALPAVARVAEELNLKGPSSRIVELTTQKNLFRPLQVKLGLERPNFIEVDNFRQAIKIWDYGPAVVKPAVSSGSRGVAMLKKVDTRALTSFQEASDYSYTNTVCLEEYIYGQDICVEGFVLNGKVKLAFITKKHVQGFVVIGHELPYKLNSTNHKQILNQLQTIITSINYDAGPFDADFRINPQRAVLLEMTPRLGGNGAPALIEFSYGTSLIELSIKHAMGELISEADTIKGGRASPAASILLRSQQEGVVATFATEKAIRSRIPEVEELHLNLSPGQTVKPFTHGGHTLGYSVVNLANNLKFDRIESRILEALNITFN